MPKTIPTQPISDNDNLLIKKFYEDVAAQSALMDSLAEKLITLELAIPGLYAVILKLMYGEDATLLLNWAFYLTFGCWFIALVLAFLAIWPKKWIVNPDIMVQKLKKYKEGIGIEDYFVLSARRKKFFLIPSALFLFAGTIFAIFAMG